MGLSDYALYRLAKNWPSPMARMTRELDADTVNHLLESLEAQGSVGN
jgi:hypothetical protein